jgi:anti-sigma B factor antagonist
VHSAEETESPDAAVEVVSEQRGDQWQVSLSGRITIDSSPDLRILLMRQLESPLCRVLTVDLFDAVYIDTSGLAILVEILKASRSRGKALRLRRLREQPRYLLETTRLLHLFDQESSS